MIIANILRKRNALFIGSIVTGLIVGPAMGKISWLNLPVLIIIMTVAALELQISHFRSVKIIIRGAFSGIVLNLFVTGAIVLGLGYLLFPPGPVRDGIVLAAACPPGLAIVPFTIVMGGSVAYAVNAFSSGYLVSIFLIPLMAGILIEKDVVSIWDVIEVMGKLILIPLILSFFIRKAGFKKRIKNYYGPVVNLGFAVMFAILFGTNRHVFLHDSGQIIKLFLIFAVSVFALAAFIKVVLKQLGATRPEAISVLLSGTVKNSLFAAAIGLSLIGPAAAIPGTVLTFVLIIYLMVVKKIA